MKLTITIHGGGISEDRVVDRLPVRIGRAEGNEVLLNDTRVSRYHGVIDCDAFGCFYDDLGSTNGSLIQRETGVETVTRRTYLATGDAILFGGGETKLSLVVRALVKEAATDGPEPERSDHRDPLLATIVGEITSSPEYDHLARDPARARSILDFVDGLSRADLDRETILTVAPRLLLEMNQSLTNVVIYLRSEDGWQEQPAGSVSRAPEGGPPPLSRIIGKEVVETGKAFLFRPADPAFHTDSLVEAGIKAGICVPLCDRLGVRGVAQLTSRHAEDALCADDLRLFGAAARYVAVALENAELSHALEERNAALAVENVELRRRVGEAAALGGIVGKSRAIRRCLDLVAKVVPAETSVLISGETGTGKELIAKAIHFNGPRKEKPFVVQDCGAVAESLLESELFGHRKGSFTGGVEDKRGLFEVADGGTVFLDEIGDCSPALQMRLLRVLQEGEVRRVGELAWRKVNVRIIAATNRNLEEQMRKGSFREDLYYRLNVFPIFVPPLRERRDDIPLLVAHFLERLAERTGKRLEGISKEALDALLAYPLPGNVRELENEIERAAILAEPGGVMTRDLLSERVRNFDPSEATHGPPSCWPPLEAKGGRAEAGDGERQEMIHLLKRHAGNLTRVARALGTSRPTLYKRLRDLGIDHRDYY